MWILKHKRTGEVLGGFKTDSECINHARENGLRVWGTDREKKTVNVVDDERLTKQ